MSFEFFVARRFLKSNKLKSTISSPIVKVSVSAIAIGVFIMLISISAAAGLQLKIKEKVSAFKGHYQLY
ncbi:MAG: ABC transporter permease, partial [Flavobacteriaceae bacterium]